MLPWLSSLWLVLQKNIQFVIFVCVEVQEINFGGNLPGSKCDGDHHHNFTSLVNNMISVE